MNKKLIFCVVLSLLIVLAGCVSKSAETEEANVEIEAKATPNAMPEGMEPPEGISFCASLSKILFLRSSC